MKRILALIGLIMIGAMLLADPNTGVIAVVEEAAASTATETTTTTAPPDPGTDDPEDTATTEVETTTSDADAEDGSCDSNSDLCEAEAVTEVAVGSDGTYVGEAVGSEFGDFQVEITVENGVMTSITTLDEPSDRKSLNINDDAIPYYVEQALELQSADLDKMSGATVTWESWGASLESALEQAGLA